MADDEHHVVYVIEAEDEVTGPMAQAEEQLDKTTEAADRSTEAQEKAILKSVNTMSALQSVQSGISAITSAVSTLGLVDEETAKSLRSVAAGIQMVIGTAQAVKGV